MDLMQSIFAKAKAEPQRVAFAEADDETMMRAAAQVARDGIAVAVLVGDESSLRAKASEWGIDADLFEFSDLGDEAYTASICERYLALPTTILKEKGVARRAAKNLERSLIMEAVGDVDITFAGITSTTGDVIIAGQTIIGLAEGIDTPSSMGIFDIPGYEGAEGNLLAFGDSAVCINPTPEQLASIAISCCDSVKGLLGWEPRCALLSYSTCGSAESELTEKVVSARDIANGRRPDLAIDGEFQLDAAINPTVAARKVKRESAVAGHANLIIWPDLNVGNVGVKLVQQFAGADAYGPMLQGFARIVCDCSRGAGVSEIVGNVAMSCVRSQALEGGRA